MTGALDKAWRWVLGAGTLALLLVAITAGSARAATYPAGGGTFSGSAEGWTVVTKECKVLTLLEIGLLCEAGESGYDPAVGKPPGSLDARTKLVLNVLGVFNSDVTFRSPDFSVAEAGPATFHIDRQFALGGLLNLAPSGSYSVALLDKTSGTRSLVVEEALDAANESFVGKDAAVTVAAGHVYALEIETHVTGNVGLGLNATGDLRFDNVALTVTPAGGGGTDNGGSGNSNSNNSSSNSNRGSRGAGGGASSRLSSSKLLTLFRKSATAAPVQLRGNRLFVKVNCPAKIGRACRITAQGMLNQRKAATSKRVVKVGKGKGKRIVLHVKRNAKKRVAKRKRLLVRQKVRAGKAHATIYKSRKLIRRHPRR